MKRFLILIVLSGIFVISARGQNQYVKLQGKQFMDEVGDEFYPLVCNYSVSIVNTDTNDFSTTFLAQNKAWGPQPWSWDCNDTQSCNLQIVNDFKQIASLGFNTVRIMGLEPVFIVARSCIKSWDSNSHDWICPATGFYKLSPGVEFGGDNEQWFRLYPPYNDAVSQHYFDHIENILRIASSITLKNGKKLKVILIAGGGREYYQLDFPDAYKDYLTALGNRISSISDLSVRQALLAYDLFNEPMYSWNCHSMWPEKTLGHYKQDVCENVKKWYDALKSNDPNHLITLGGKGFREIFEYDPAILTVDFYSPHPYTESPDFEKKPVVDPNYYNKKIERIKGKYYWYQSALPMPWIIGETGFVAQDSYYYPEVDGTLEEQKDYASTTLSLVRESGGSGYSWWLYQNVLDDPSQAFFGIYDYGQCSPIPCDNNAKPVHEAFENFSPQPPGVLSKPANYYDPYYHENYNPNTNHVKGTIIDEHWKPIPNAFIKGYTRLRGFYPSTVYYEHYTFSDENGEFEIIPYDYDNGFGGMPNYNSIEAIYISAPGCSRLTCDYWDHPRGIPNNQTFQLNRNIFNYQEEYIGLDVSASENIILQSWDKITLQNVTIQSQGKCEIKTRREIQVNKEFHAYKGSETLIHLCNTFLPCENLIPESSKKSSFLESQPQKETEQHNEIQLKFIPLDLELRFSVYPNPGKGLFTVEVPNFDFLEKVSLTVFDQFGKELFSTTVFEEILQLDLSSLSKGVYIIKIETTENFECKKIVIV